VNARGRLQEECSRAAPGAIHAAYHHVGGILGLWLIGPFRTAKVETSTDTVASSEAPGTSLHPSNGDDADSEG